MGCRSDLLDALGIPLESRPPGAAVSESERRAWELDDETVAAVLVRAGFDLIEDGVQDVDLAVRLSDLAASYRERARLRREGRL